MLYFYIYEEGGEVNEMIEEKEQCHYQESNIIQHANQYTIMEVCFLDFFFNIILIYLL